MIRSLIMICLFTHYSRLFCLFIIYLLLIPTNYYHTDPLLSREQDIEQLFAEGVAITEQPSTSEGGWLSEGQCSECPGNLLLLRSLARELRADLRHSLQCQGAQGVHVAGQLAVSP